MPEAWEMQPDETEKAYSRFLMYRDLDPSLPQGHPDLRTIANVATRLGMSTQGVSNYSKKYGWVERCRAWDEHRAKVTIVLRDASLEEFQESVTRKLMVQTAALEKIVDEEVRQTLKDQASGIRIQGLELTRLVGALTQLDNLRRRAAGMPTSYSRATSDHVPDDEIFFIGGDDEG